MDFKVINAKTSKHTLFKEFEYFDLIPYSIALVMLIGTIYFVYQVLHLFPNSVD